MLYAVSAKLIPDRGPEFHTRLTDGSIAAQRPDGAEIVAAMQRARVAPDGTVRWTETCYCPAPLQHERATVLDRSPFHTPSHNGRQSDCGRGCSRSSAAGPAAPITASLKRAIRSSVRYCVVTPSSEARVTGCFRMRAMTAWAASCVATAWGNSTINQTNA
jgi:hypothetical protein